MNREYYSVRTGKYSDNEQINLELLKDLFKAVYQDFVRKDFFYEAYGFECVDSGFNPGIAGEDIEIFFYRRLRKRNLWPIEEKCYEYSEDDLFDVIELLFDLISKPIEGYYHNYYSCGQHWTKFDKYQDKLNFGVKLIKFLRIMRMGTYYQRMGKYS